MSPPHEKPQASLERHLVRGTAVGMLLRWSDRIIGLVSTVILVRILSPEDYGILAIATVIVAAVEVFSQAGRFAVIIRHPNPLREHYDTAWTVGLMLDLVTATLILALSPLTIVYFHEPRALVVVQVLALRVVLNGCQNIGVADFRRNLNFRKQFWFQLIPAIGAFGIQVSAGYILRSYWALVIGVMTQGIISVVLSYLMSPYRPRPSLARFKEIWSFSGWMLLRNAGALASQEVDKVAIGGFAGTVAMGHYNVAREVATIPGQELLGPMAQVLLPVMASGRSNPLKQQRLYLTVLYWAGVIFAVTGIGVALVAKDMTALLLGPQWQDVDTLIPWFSLSFGIAALSSSVYTAFDTLDRPDMATKLQWFRVICFVAAVSLAAYLYQDVMAVIVARFLITLFLTPALFFALGTAMKIPPSLFLGALWRPLTAGFIMAASVLALNMALWFSGPLRLVLDMGIGGMVFACSLFALWFAAGKPFGPEHDILPLIRKYIGMEPRSVGPAPANTDS